MSATSPGLSRPGEAKEGGLAFAQVTTDLRKDLDGSGIVRLVGEDRFYETVAAGVDDLLARRAGQAAPFGSR